LREKLVRAKAKTNESLVLIANQEACKAAVGNDSWKELVEQAHMFVSGFRLLGA
jgi:hypothetical protein